MTRCSFTSWILGLSPGATALLITVRALACVTERTVAAASQGSPKSAKKPPMATMSSRSRWNPEPFCSIRSFLLMISLGTRAGCWQRSAQHGTAQLRMARHGIAQDGTARFGTGQYSMAWHGTCCPDAERLSLARLSTTWHGAVAHSTAWPRWARLSMAWHSLARLSTAQDGRAENGTAQRGMAQRSSAQHGTARHGAPSPVHVPARPRCAHVVICVSMKMRMKTRTAGRPLATIIHTGKSLLSPSGLITQPRLSGAVTENPLGTLSFCGGTGRCGVSGTHGERAAPVPHWGPPQGTTQRAPGRGVQIPAGGIP